MRGVDSAPPAPGRCPDPLSEDLHHGTEGEVLARARRRTRVRMRHRIRCRRSETGKNADAAAAAHGRLQQAGDRQDRRRAQDVHEYVPQGRRGGGGALIARRERKGPGSPGPFFSDGLQKRIQAVRTPPTENVLESVWTLIGHLLATSAIFVTLFGIAW